MVVISPLSWHPLGSLRVLQDHVAVHALECSAGRHHRLPLELVLRALGTVHTCTEWPHWIHTSCSVGAAVLTHVNAVKPHAAEACEHVQLLHQLATIGYSSSMASTAGVEAVNVRQMKPSSPGYILHALRSQIPGLVLTS
jgi:hypothetical protein